MITLKPFVITDTYATVIELIVDNDGNTLDAVQETLEVQFTNIEMI